MQSDLRFIYKKIYNDKQKGIFEIFDKYHIPLLKDLDHPALIEERKQNIYAAAYGKKLNQDLKLPSKKKNIDRHDSLD